LFEIVEHGMVLFFVGPVDFLIDTTAWAALHVPYTLACTVPVPYPKLFGGGTLQAQRPWMRFMLSTWLVLISNLFLYLDRYLNMNKIVIYVIMLYDMVRCYQLSVISHIIHEAAMANANDDRNMKWLASIAWLLD
jgi:hypothetical protein